MKWNFFDIDLHLAFGNIEEMDVCVKLAAANPNVIKLNIVDQLLTIAEELPELAEISISSHVEIEADTIVKFLKYSSKLHKLSVNIPTISLCRNVHRILTDEWILYGENEHFIIERENKSKGIVGSWWQLNKGRFIPI